MTSEARKNVSGASPPEREGYPAERRASRPRGASVETRVLKEVRERRLSDLMFSGSFLDWCYIRLADDYTPLLKLWRILGIDEAREHYRQAVPSLTITDPSQLLLLRQVVEFMRDCKWGSCVNMIQPQSRWAKIAPRMCCCIRIAPIPMHGGMRLSAAVASANLLTHTRVMASGPMRGHGNRS